MLADKDVAGVAAILAPMAELVIATSPPSPRAASAEQVAKECAKLGVETLTAATVRGAVAQAMEQAGEGDCILLTGSFYTVAEARATALGLS
jgi:dihydrofolate synthase/folylpolyglutamate synthase